MGEVYFSLARASPVHKRYLHGWVHTNCSRTSTSYIFANHACEREPASWITVIVTQYYVASGLKAEQWHLWI